MSDDLYALRDKVAIKVHCLSLTCVSVGGNSSLQCCANAKHFITHVHDGGLSYAEV